MPRKRLVIRGIVQGVGYRMSAHREGSRLGLKGWVRNRRDTSVEAIVEGDDATIERFVAWCKKGPPSSRVDSVDVEDDPSTESFASLEIRPTA